MKLRGYENIKILKNVDNPVMFLGYPLKLAYMYVGSIILGFLSAMAISTMGVHWSWNLIIPIIIIALGVGLVSIYYKRYGLNGYFLEQENKYFPDQIQGDQSFQQYIKQRKNKQKIK